MVNRGTIGLNSLPKTVTRQRRDCDVNPGPSAPEFSTLTTRLPSHPLRRISGVKIYHTFRYAIPRLLPPWRTTFAADRRLFHELFNVSQINDFVRA